MNLRAKSVFSICLLGLLCVMMPGSLRADAVTVYMNASGAVPTVDRSATFDSITTGTSLTSYSEDGLLFSIPGATAFEGFTPAPAGFSGNFFYPAGGSSNPLTITTTDSALLYGIQFFVGSGFLAEDAPGSVLPITYQVNDVTPLQSGTFDAVQTAAGYLLGFSDPSGFTTLKINICSPGTITNECFLSSSGAIAIDNVTADLTAPSVAVPEPSAFSLMLTGSLGLMMLMRKRIAQAA